MSTPHSSLRSRILTWYRSQRRDLPWRRTKDPYAIWVSEIMLQQTRVDTVIPYYERFLKRWPTVEDLAEADQDEVRAAWSGLGYYQRLRWMLSAARTVVSDHTGRFPSDPTELRSLPGFGRYTAGAVASIAFDAPVPAVDGNVGRFIARLEGLDGDITRGPNERRIWEVASQLADGDHPGDLNQALIELGALVCMSRNPTCTSCPAQPDCVAHREGRQDTIPPPKRKTPRKQIVLSALLHVDTGPAIWLEKQPEDGLFGGLLCPPFVDGALEQTDLAQRITGRGGWTLDGTKWSGDSIEAMGEVVHKLTHRDLHIHIFRIPAHPRRGWIRVPLDQLANRGIPSVTTKCLRQGLPPHLRHTTRSLGRQTEAHRREREGQQKLPLD